MSSPYNIYNKDNLPLYNEVNKNNNTDYNTYRCFNNAKFTNPPWFPDENICPCNPENNNISGRGYTLCDYGIIEKERTYGPSANLITKNQFPNKDRIIGSLFNTQQTVPPQLDPNPQVRIGEMWRSIY